MKSSTLTVVAATLASLPFSGCSGTISNQAVLNPAANPTGIRYYQPQQVELALYLIKPKSGTEELTVQRIGDHLVLTVPDPDRMQEVSYSGALFDSKSFSMVVQDGIINKIGLDSTSNATPPAVGALNAVSTALTTGQQAPSAIANQQLSDLQLQLNLLKAKYNLENYKPGQ
jgi:hypothetical protein